MTAKHGVARLASPALSAIRELYCEGGSDVQRAAALVEIAGAAATLARTIYRYRHVDPVTVAGLVSRRCDVAPVLGRGRWLPTMTYHVPEPPAPAPKRSSMQRPRVTVRVVQPALFPAVPARPVATIVGGAR